MKRVFWLATVVAVVGMGSGAGAQHGGHQHAVQTKHASHTTPSRLRAETPAVREFHAAHARMMRGMDVPFTGDADVDFRTHMISHHQGAIDMAQVALRHSKDPHTRQVAEAIRVMQPREIYEFQGWLAGRRAAAADIATGNSPATREFKAAHARMMRNMAMPFTGDPDVDFRMHMIPHHQGAIDMVRIALRHAKDLWTRQNAEAIIITQQQEIYQFQTWLARHGKKSQAGGQHRYIVNAGSYPQRNDASGYGTQAELARQTEAPGAGVPQQP